MLIAPIGRNCACGRWIPSFGRTCITCGATYPGISLGGPRFVELRAARLTREDLAEYDGDATARRMVANVARFFLFHAEEGATREPSSSRAPRDSAKKVEAYLARAGLVVHAIEPVTSPRRTRERWSARCTRDGTEVVITSCDRLKLCARTGVRVEGLTAYALPLVRKRAPRRHAEASA